jgi:glutamine amidotransferase
MIVVIDYGMGNLRSITKVLEKLGAEYKISDKEKDIRRASHLILPGVGHFEEGISTLRKNGMIDVLREEVLEKKKPFLGICLGMQLLFKTSEEGGLVEGLGFINGEIKKFDFSKHKEQKIPHVGWNEIRGTDMEKITILDGIEEGTNFYFVHSYHAVLDDDALKAFTDYGYEFISAVQKGNIYGTQFHPEKSQKKGLTILKNFIEVQPC